MESIKKYITDEAITISKMPHNSYKNAKRLIVGREDINEIRSYLTLENPLFNIDFDIEKIELVLFLKEIDLKNNTDRFMLSIGIVTENLKENITWTIAPKFFQESIMYKVSTDCKEKYIKFDITYLYKKYNKYITGNFYLVLLGLNANATVEFASITTEKKGYLEIYTSNKRNISNENKSKIEKKEIKTAQNSMQNFTEKEGRQDNNTTKANANKQKELNTSKIYCEVYTNENNIIKRGKFNNIFFEKLASYNGAYLDKENLGIIVLKAGVYNIQYSINCISEGISTMAISIDDAIIESSIVQVGNNESQIVGQCIVRLNKGNEKIRLNVDGDRIVLINIGVVAKISIIEI